MPRPTSRHPMEVSSFTELPLFFEAHKEQNVSGRHHSDLHEIKAMLTELLEDKRRRDSPIITPTVQEVERYAPRP